MTQNKQQLNAGNVMMENDEVSAETTDSKNE